MEPIFEFNLFSYNIHLYDTQFTLKPLIGNHHSVDFDSKKVKTYMWYFIWLLFQVEVYKKA